jgi:hypothetical protein
MTSHAKLNLVGMLSVPLIAVIVGVYAFGPRLDTAISLFAINAVPLLIAGLISGLMLRKSESNAARYISISPTLIPAIWFCVWYLWLAAFPPAVAPGAEFIAGPQYLIPVVLVLGIIAWVTRRFVH